MHSAVIDHFVFVRGSKGVTVKEDDMTTEKNGQDLPGIVILFNTVQPW